MEFKKYTMENFKYSSKITEASITQNNNSFTLVTKNPQVFEIWVI